MLIKSLNTAEAVDNVIMFAGAYKNGIVYRLNTAEAVDNVILLQGEDTGKKTSQYRRSSRQCNRVTTPVKPAGLNVSIPPKQSTM